MFIFFFFQIAKFDQQIFRPSSYDFSLVSIFDDNTNSENNTYVHRIQIDQFILHDARKFLLGCFQTEQVQTFKGFKKK